MSVGLKNGGLDPPACHKTQGETRRSRSSRARRAQRRRRSHDSVVPDSYGGGHRGQRARHDVLGRGVLAHGVLPLAVGFLRQHVRLLQRAVDVDAGLPVAHRVAHGAHACAHGPAGDAHRAHDAAAYDDAVAGLRAASRLVLCAMGHLRRGVLRELAGDERAGAAPHVRELRVCQRVRHGRWHLPVPVEHYAHRIRPGRRRRLVRGLRLVGGRRPVGGRRGRRVEPGAQGKLQPALKAQGQAPRAQGAALAGRVDVVQVLLCVASRRAVRTR